MNDENVDYRKIEKEWEEEIKKPLDAFVEEFTFENPELVKEARLDFLQRKLDKQIEKNLWWMEVLLSIRKTPWFKEAVRDYLFSEMDKAEKIKREIEFYKNPQEVNLEGMLTVEEIERAHNADCSKLLETKKKGKHSFSLCPFHKEKTPSFCCFSGGKYKCFGCGAHGDAIDLVMKLHNLNFIQAVKKLQ